MKIEDIDALPENVIIAERANPVLAGVVQHTEVWEQVSPLVGPILTFDKHRTIRADSWTRTAWAALVEMFAAGNGDFFVLREQMQATAAAKRSGLLQAWTDADKARTNELIGEASRISDAVQVVDAAQRLVDYVVGLDFAAQVKDDAEAIEAGSLISPHDVAARAEQFAQERCRPRLKAVPACNIEVLFREWLTDTRAKKLLTGFAGLDALSGGLDCGNVTGICGRSNDGKTALLLALGLAQVCPGSASYDFRQQPDKRSAVSMDDNRTFVLWLSVEMTRGDILTRMASSLLLIDNTDLLRDKLQAIYPRGAEFEQLVCLLGEQGRLTLLDAEMLGSTTPQAVCAALQAWATSIYAAHPDAKLVACLDYLQFLGDEKCEDERYEELTAAMRQILTVTKAQRIATVVGLQCADGTHPTQRSDIRASKALIDDCSAIWVIRRNKDVETLLDLYSEKARYGAKHWTAGMYIEGRYSLITDLPTSNVEDDGPYPWERP